MAPLRDFLIGLAGIFVAIGVITAGLVKVFRIIRNVGRALEEVLGDGTPEKPNMLVVIRTMKTQVDRVERRLEDHIAASSVGGIAA